MPLPGLRGISLWAVLKQLVRRTIDHTVPDRAAQLAYYFLFAVFPMLAFMVTLAAYLPVENAVSRLIQRASYVMPDEMVTMLEDQLNSLLHQSRPRILTIGFLVAWWSASRGVNALRDALNLAHDVKESRPFWKTQGLSLLLTAAGALLLVLGVTGMVFGGKAGYWLAHRLNVGSEYLRFWAWLRWPIVAVLLMLSLALTYYLLPDVKQRFRFLTLGSALSTIAWLAATWGFTKFVEHFGKYDVTYGAIGGVIVLLTWLYISGFLYIMGGEINAIFEHLSPEGKPAGARTSARPVEPAVQRPSVAPPGVAKSATSSQRSDEKASRRT